MNMYVKAYVSICMYTVSTKISQSFLALTLKVVNKFHQICYIALAINA